MLALTASSCGRVTSLAKAWRCAVVQAEAPESQASASGTMWSMSRLDAEVTVRLSYGETQVPEVAAQLESVTTLEPSRLRTVSRVLQVPEMVIQVGNRSRL